MKQKILVIEDGKTGLEIAELIKPDLILLDIQLPVMDGYTVAKNLRNNPNITLVSLKLLRHAHIQSPNLPKVEDNCLILRRVYLCLEDGIKN